MRKSRYTVVADGNREGESLLFNTANGAFAVVQSGLESHERELLEAGLYTELSPEEELAEQQAAFDMARTDKDALTLNILPTYACNFACPYCYEPDSGKSCGKMQRNVMDAVMRFVRLIYDEHAFSKLSVQWYGGDPSLALDVVEAISSELIAWCDEHGIAYEAMMLTNANIIGEAEADLLARCRVTSVMLTIEGPKDIHNARRVPLNGSDSYERTLEAARLMRERGITLNATMNTDKISFPVYAALRDELLREEGISLMLGKLNDYGCTFGKGAFSAPEFDLFTHDEFFEAQAGQFISEGHSAEDFRALLTACDRFCTGQLENYFVIDMHGDVYACDGWVGNKEYARFNVLDDPSTWKMNEISHDATRDAKCSECEILPICHGSCIWERTCCEKSEGKMPCHPLKTTLPEYLRAWRECYDTDSERTFIQLA